MSKKRLQKRIEDVAKDLFARREALAAVSREREKWREGIEAEAYAPIEPIDGDKLKAEVAQMLAGITPMTPEQERSHHFTERIAPRLRDFGFSERYRREITDWQCEPQRLTYLDCVNAFTRCGAIVALVGVRGTGKTTIGAQLAIRRIREDWQSCEDKAEGRRAATTWRATPYRKLTTLIARLKALYADFGSVETESLMAARDAYVSHDLAIIDELHECDEQRLKDRVLTDILDRRYSANTDTLLISNQTPEGFRETTNESVLSRITEHGCIIECTWQSWRERRQH